MRTELREFKLGDWVRSWDFEPMDGREDRYIEGTIVEVTEDTYVINVHYDSTGMNRPVVETGKHMLISEFENRIEYV